MDLALDAHVLDRVNVLVGLLNESSQLSVGDLNVSDLPVLLHRISNVASNRPIRRVLPIRVGRARNGERAILFRLLVELLAVPGDGALKVGTQQREPRVIEGLTPVFVPLSSLLIFSLLDQHLVDSSLISLLLDSSNEPAQEFCVTVIQLSKRLKMLA